MEHEKAEACFKRIIELDPNNYRAYYNLGITCYNLGNMDLALKMCENALNLKPDYEHCYYNIGLIYEAKNDLNKALEYYERALQLEPKFTYSLQARDMVRKELDLIRENKSLSD
jgi:tetratricopeptide (TPR) repeat protein